MRLIPGIRVPNDGNVNYSNEYEWKNLQNLVEIIDYGQDDVKISG
jgi:hypothetical protein